MAQYKNEGSCTPKRASGRRKLIDEETTGNKMLEEVKMDCEVTAVDL